MIHITQSAYQELLRLKDPQKPYLRIGVKGGGCAGLEYVLEYVEAPSSHDLIFQYDQLTYIIDKRHLLYVEGATLDYPKGLANRGFVFQNPHAKTTCGCGTSFSI